jgi:hypothetical protein
MKPVVTYHGLHSPLEIGMYAIITGLRGHPRQSTGQLDGDFVYTSAIVRVGDGGEFETLNTVYRPEEAK